MASRHRGRSAAEFQVTTPIVTSGKRPIVAGRLDAGEVGAGRGGFYRKGPAESCRRRRSADADAGFVRAAAPELAAAIPCVCLRPRAARAGGEAFEPRR